MSDYQSFIDNIKKKTAIDLSLYKEAQMKRRLEGIKNKHGLLTFSAYFNAMEKNEEIFLEFLDKMTINVSEFYRNAKRWDVLEKKILPRLIRDNSKLKFWSAACSSGEEPYTLAMVASKYITLSQLSILASDIDYNVLEYAKTGLYHERSLLEVPEEMKKKFFTKEGKLFKLKKDVKDAVKFKRQNLLQDTFETGFDLIVCRNVMIYFTEEAKDVLYRKFSESLKTGGVLFVGSTEQILQPEKYGFVSEEVFFYRKL